MRDTDENEKQEMKDKEEKEEKKSKFEEESGLRKKRDPRLTTIKRYWKTQKQFAN